MNKLIVILYMFLLVCPLKSGEQDGPNKHSDSSSDHSRHHSRDHHQDRLDRLQRLEKREEIERLKVEQWSMKYKIALISALTGGAGIILKYLFSWYLNK